VHWRAYGKVVSIAHRREAPKAWCGHYENTCRVNGWTPPESATQPGGIASRIRRRWHVDGVLHRRRCRFDDVLDDRRHRGGSVIRVRRRLACGEGDLVLELANALRKGLRLGLARRFAGRIFPRHDFRRTRVKDVGDANPLGRRDRRPLDWRHAGIWLVVGISGAAVESVVPRPNAGSSPFLA
jgi:hypothetical protein